MSVSLTSLERQLRDLTAQLPVKFSWFKGASQPDVSPRGLTLWEDDSLGIAKLLMRYGQKTFVFQSVDAASGSGFALTSTQVTAGAGLLGGGDLSMNRSFAVGAGAGITVNADDVAVDQNYAFVWGGAQRRTTYEDLDAIASPANPTAGRARFFSKLSGGIATLFVRRSDGTETELGGSISAANPTAKVGPSVVNGVATTFMRSDAAPPIDLTQTYAWTGAHTIKPATSTNQALIVLEDSGRGQEDEMMGWERNGAGTSTINRFKTAIGPEGYLTLFREETNAWDSVHYPPNKSGIFFVKDFSAGAMELVWVGSDGASGGTTEIRITDAAAGGVHLAPTVSRSLAADWTWSGGRVKADNLLYGSGSPAGSVSAIQGALYQNLSSPSYPWVHTGGDGTTSGWIEIQPIQRVIKSGDTSRNTTTTLVADPDLAFNTLSSRTYRFRIIVWFNTGATPDFKWAIQHSGAVTFFRMHATWTAAGETTLTTMVPDTAVATPHSITGTTGGEGRLEIEGVLVSNSNNSLVFQWAQDTSDAGATIVRQGSFIEWVVS